MVVAVTFHKVEHVDRIPWIEVGKPDVLFLIQVVFGLVVARAHHGERIARNTDRIRVPEVFAFLERAADRFYFECRIRTGEITDDLGRDNLDGPVGGVVGQEQGVDCRIALADEARVLFVKFELADRFSFRIQGDADTFVAREENFHGARPFAYGEYAPDRVGQVHVDAVLFAGVDKVGRINADVSADSRSLFELGFYFHVVEAIVEGYEGIFLHFAVVTGNHVVAKNGIFLGFVPYGLKRVQLVADFVLDSYGVFAHARCSNVDVDTCPFDELAEEQPDGFCRIGDVDVATLLVNVLLAFRNFKIQRNGVAEFQGVVIGDVRAVAQRGT